MGQIEGLGDIIERMTSGLGVQPCAGCKKRKRWLNEKVPFGKEKGCSNCDKSREAPATEKREA